EGEPHLFDPETVFRLQHSTRNRRYDIFKQYTDQGAGTGPGLPRGRCDPHRHRYVVVPGVREREPAACRHRALPVGVCRSSIAAAPEIPEPAVTRGIRWRGRAQTR
ncbi:hypothetical protein ABTZ98_26765, partial [Streptomyces bacillaris]